MNIFNLFKFFTPGIFKSPYVSNETEKKIITDWERIKQLLKVKGPSQLRQALITADKTLDNALKDLVVGESMGERLKNAKNHFDSVTYNKIWEAHKIRNSLVHETDFEPPYYALTEAVNNIKDALLQLRVKINQR